MFSNTVILLTPAEFGRSEALECNVEAGSMEELHHMYPSQEYKVYDGKSYIILPVSEVIPPRRSPETKENEPVRDSDQVCIHRVKVVLPLQLYADTTVSAVLIRNGSRRDTRRDFYTRPFLESYSSRLGDYSHAVMSLYFEVLGFSEASEQAGGIFPSADGSLRQLQEFLSFVRGEIQSQDFGGNRFVPVEFIFSVDEVEQHDCVLTGDVHEAGPLELFFCLESSGKPGYGVCDNGLLKVYYSDGSHGNVNEG